MIRLLLEAIKEWVESLLDGFVEKGNPQDSKSITGRYNVLDFGLDNKQNGKIDNSTLLSQMLNTIPEGSIVYFPQGVYVFHDTVEITKSVKFVGESIIKHRSNLQNVLQPQSSILFAPSVANKTLFVRVRGEFDVEKLSFFGNNSFDVAYNTDTFDGTLPYRIWKTTTTLEGINCIDCAYHGVTSTGEANNGTMAIVRDCTFYGFSGYALAYELHRYVVNCGFMQCNKAIIFTGTDNMVQNCWVCRGNIGIECTHEAAAFTNLEVSNTWCDQMAGHFIKCDKTGENNTLLINDCWVDMIDNSAIYCEGYLYHSKITGRYSRTGMSYAHTDEQTVARAYAEFYKMDAIVASRIYNSDIDISVHKRTIGQAGRVLNPNGKCPYRAISASDNAIITQSRLKVDEKYEDAFDNTAMFQPQETFIKTLDSEMEKFSLWNYENRGILYRTSSPVGKAQAPRAGMLCIDTSKRDVYISTGAKDVNAWENFLKESDIDFTALLGGDN